MMEIYQVHISVSTDTAISTTKVGEYTETAKTYKNSNQKYPDPKVIKKEKLLLIDSVMKNSIYNSTPFLSYKTFCKKEDIETAKKLLRNEIKSRISELNKGVLHLISASNIERIKK